MNIAALRSAIAASVFLDTQVRRVFVAESASNIRTQLSRWTTQGQLVRIKRGVYHFAERPIEELNLSQWLYTPSYISLETALNIQGILPDVAQQVTSITPTTTRSFQTAYGTYSYAKIKPALFFGFSSEGSGDQAYQLAHPEKAVLDYLYLRHVTSISEARLQLSRGFVRSRRFCAYLAQFPRRVSRVLEEVR